MVGRAEKYSKKLLKKIWVVFKVGDLLVDLILQICFGILG